LVLGNFLKKGIDVLLDVLETPYFVDRTEEIRSRLYSGFEYPEGIFDSTIVGMEDLKRIIIKCIGSKEPINILLCGPPACAKTLFLLAIHKQLSGCYFVDGANSSGAGMIDYLFEYPETKILLIDELDKINKRDQANLLNLLETGMLSSTKVGKTEHQIMQIKVFSTSNDAEKISKPLRSRMLEFHLKAYSYEEFLDISKELLSERYNHRNELSEAIAGSVWNIMRSKDVRDVLAIGKLASSVEDVHFIVQTMKKYGSALAEQDSSISSRFS
jgi:replication-associated recombination protein RarA